MPWVHQINVSEGGVPKLPIASAEVTEDGVVGDAHHDKVHHGGLERALCLFSLEVIETFRSEGHSVEPGSAGENLTISGMDWADMVPGTRIAIGEVVAEITSYTSPCATNAGWFKDGDFTRMLQSWHPGESRVYARVTRPGTVVTGDEVRLLV
ncbi:MAG: MOSC domain-containing protein [Acidimicrobiia bacterium]